MKSELPKALRFQGRTLNSAGQGRVPGSHVYFDVARGEAFDLYLARVAQVGPLFGLAEVPGNAAMPRVRVDQALLNGDGPMAVGDVLVVGPITYAPAGPRAQAAWRMRPAETRDPRPAPAPRPAPRDDWKLGTLKVLKGPDWGFLHPLDGGPDVFVHARSLRGGATLSFGLRLRFKQVVTAKGLAALEVWPG
jgi:cold shock CspA family protein